MSTVNIKNLKFKIEFNSLNGSFPIWVWSLQVLLITNSNFRVEPELLAPEVVPPATGCQERASPCSVTEAFVEGETKCPCCF